MQLPLRFKGHATGVEDVLIGRVCTSVTRPGDILLDPAGETIGATHSNAVNAVLTSVDVSGVGLPKYPTISGIQNLSFITPGDVVAIYPSGQVDSLFRAGSLDNALFATDRCNSNCLMCSQPPKPIDDLDSQYHINSRLIPLIPKDTSCLGLTGGEPTLLGWRLLRLFRQLGSELPGTELQVLTNGRAFAHENIVTAVAAAVSAPTIFCVPVYSDFAWHHDYVVQARGAHSQTIAGLYNLARSEMRIEIRVVLHAQTVSRLPALAKFIHRNLPFAEHVALMGLEYTGYTPFNDGVLWIDPPDYHGPLQEAVEYLDGFGVAVSLYNLPLCLLPASLWPFARCSISDWKREYHSECSRCSVREACGGVFATSKKHSPSIRAVAPAI